MKFSGESLPDDWETQKRMQSVEMGKCCDTDNEAMMTFGVHRLLQ